MLYLAIPAHNEVATIGVLLWRLRTVLAEFPREYEVVVYDDASTDETADVARQYEHAMPVTVLRGQRHLGYAGAVDALLRHVAGHTRYPRRDAVLLLQGDFTDPPEIVPEFARRFEGGADLVVGERQVVADAPVAVRRLFRGAHWALRPFVRVDGVRDLTASMRLVRISALRDALRDAGDVSVVQGDSWTANADLLLRLAPHARRVESVPVEPTYGVRMRETRRVALRDALAALKWGWGARGRRVATRVETEVSGDGDRRAGRNARRREEPELSVEKLRDKVREARGGREVVEEQDPRGRRRRSERSERSERTEKPERQVRAAKPEHQERTATPERQERAAKPERPRKPQPAAESQVESAPRERTPRPERAPRAERGRRSERDGHAPPVPASTALDATLDDPFAPPPPRIDPFAAALDRESPSVAPRHVDTPSPAPQQDAVADDDTIDADGATDGVDEETDNAEGIVATDGTAGEVRKRRRRSRRGRRRRGSERGEADTESDTVSSAEDAADSGDNTPHAAESAERSDVDDDSADDDAAEDGDQPRARRRGRRGRRGGSRRSRHRREQEGQPGDNADSQGSSGAPEGTPPT